MGGDLLVRGTVALARRLRVPPVVVAATVVGFGTSLPELVVSVRATLTGYPGLIIGNVVGSNIANVLLVGGVAAVVCPLVRENGAVRRNIVIMAGATAVFAAIVGIGEFGTGAGRLLLGAFIVIMAATARSTIRAQKEADTSTPLDWVLGLPTRLGMICIFLVAGIVMLPLGAELLVESAVAIASSFEVREEVVGLTVLAIGTSLPELTTTVLAALQRRSDVAIGAIIGSNTFNILAIMGVTASLSPTPIAVSGRLLLFDVPIMLVTTLGLVLFAWKPRPIGRGAGIAMLLAYVAYLGTLYLFV
jgi:cation:H+ antiporter